MPVLTRPESPATITLPPRSALLAAQADVLIVGGGPAGLGAAIGAASAGARVVLAERYGFLGGNATAALVAPLMSFHTSSAVAGEVCDAAMSLVPRDHGPGESVIGGALASLLDRLVAAGGAIPPSLRTGYVVPFDPEVFKGVALDLLDDAGVCYILHAFASGVTGDSIPDGVVFETKSGPLAIQAHAIVDCTGDGDVAASAGASFALGRDPDGLAQPMTLMFRVAEFAPAAFEAYALAHPNQWRGVHGLWDLVARATATGELELPREDILLFATPHASEVSVNSTRITRVRGIDVWDLAYAEWAGRRQLRQVAAFLRRYVPGFEKAYVAQSGTQVGVRESRRIDGEYTLTADDVLGAHRFADVIARSAYPIDIHNPRGSGTTLKRVPLGAAYDIPLRCLIPRNVDRLLVAGRCLSGTHEAHSSYRVMPVAMATGQAAGVCAALAARKRESPRAIPAAAVQAELVRQGANLWPMR